MKYPHLHPNHPLNEYDDQAQRLHELTRLFPVQILSERLTCKEAPHKTVVKPPAPGNFRIVGIRLFHCSRDVVIEDVTNSGFSVVRGPFDAAAFTLETPLPPLAPLNESRYRGEALRFVAVDWGYISIESPLTILARAWGTPCDVPSLTGYLVLEAPEITDSNEP